MKRPLVLLLLALVVALTGALAVWLVLGGAQPSATSAGPPSEINEIPLYDGAVNVEKESDRRDLASLRYEVDAEVAKVETFYKQDLARSHWESDWVNYRRVGGDSVNLDWRAPKYDDTVRRHFFGLNKRPGKPYDLSAIVEISDNRGVSWAAARTLVEISLVRVPHLDEVPVIPDATEVEQAGNLTTNRTTATVDELTDFYANLLPSHGWYYQGALTDPVTRENLPGTLFFVTRWHGLDATLQIRSERAADGKLFVNMRAHGSELTPKQ